MHVFRITFYEAVQHKLTKLDGAENIYRLIERMRLADDERIDIYNIKSIERIDKDEK